MSDPATPRRSDPVRRWAAVLLALQAIAVTSPITAFAGYVLGGQVMGRSISSVRIADVFGQGLAQALTPLLGILLLLAAWGVWHTTRGVGALLLQPAVLAFALVPFLRPLTPAATLPGGSLAVVALTAATFVALVLLVRRRPTSVRGGRLRWWWLVGFGVGIALLTAVGTTSTQLPSDPTRLLAESGSGAAPPLAAAMSESPTQQNPGLAPNPFNSIHNDSWATDAYGAGIGPTDPVGAPVDSVFTGGDCATITFDSGGRIVTLCSSLTRLIAYVIDPRDLTVIDSKEVGTRTPDVTDFSGGGYFVLDDRDQVVFPASDGSITVLQTSPEITVIGRHQVSDQLQPGEKITSVMPDWQDRYWFVGSMGTVGVLPRAGGSAQVITLAGESIENSFAVTRDGIYVATGAALYRLQARPGGPPTVRWRTPYDIGERRKPGQTSRATGTTPTVFAGGDRVAITDNADPRMHVVVADTDTGAVTCTQPVFEAGRSATENSLVAVGDTLIVENNYGYAPPIMSTTNGRTTTPGLAAIRVAADGSCSQAWENTDIAIPSLVSKAAVAGGVLLTYTKPASAIGVDAWYFTGIRLDNGAVAWRRLAGTGIPFNNHYAAVALSPDGDMLVGTVNGIAVLRHR